MGEMTIEGDEARGGGKVEPSISDFDCGRRTLAFTDRLLV